MFKKIRKLLQEDLAQRYQNFEERYLRFENKVYKTLEDRLNSLEQRFDELANVLSGKGNGDSEKSKSSRKEARENRSEEGPQSAPPAEGNDPADLKLLRGLGKTMEEKLRAAGIGHLAQIAALNDQAVEELDTQIPGFAVRYRRNDWKNQAENLLKG